MEVIPSRDLNLLYILLDIGFLLILAGALLWCRKYLAALFNSRLMQFWFLRRGKMQGDFFQMDTAPVLRAPIRVPGLPLLREAERLADALAVRYCPEEDERMNELMEDIYGLSPQEREVVIQACSSMRAGRESLPE